MTAKTKPAQLDKLKSLADEPNEQVKYALELLAKERSRQIVEAALQVLRDYPPDLEARPVLLDLYKYYSTDPTKRDTGADLRSAILKIGSDIWQPADIPVLERAATTYEYVPSMSAHEVMGAKLRSAGLLALYEVDKTLAGFHSARILVDYEHTSQMSGEPALTAVKLLAAQQNYLLLYAYILRDDPQFSEVIAACLKSLTTLPASLLGVVVEKYGNTQDEIVLVGLFDLLLAHEAGVNYISYIVGFLATTRAYDVYRYVALSIITTGKKALVAAFLEQAQGERNPTKLEILIEILGLSRSNDALIKELKARLEKPNRRA